MNKVIAFSIGSLALAALAHAEPAAEKTDMAEVVVKGQMLRPEETAYTATVLVNEQIRLQSPSDIDELFRSVPGMAVRDLQLGSVANSIVIRGFGGGGHGGDLGAVIDGIPLNEAMSHADGYVDLNAIVPLEIDTFAVFKGPVSALYGNYNRGGLINVQTRKGGEYAETDISLGSFETMDLQAAYGGELGASQQLNLAGRVFRTDSYRPQSDTRRSTFAGRWATDVTPALQLALSTRYLDSESSSASYLTLAQFQSDLRSIDPRVMNDGAEKELLTVRADVNYQISDDLKLLTFGYTTRQDFTRWFTRPINPSTWRQREETYDRTVYGAGSSLNGSLAPASTKINYVAGVEIFRESTDFMFFDGLDRRLRTAPAQSDRETRLNSVSAFAEVEADLHPLARAYVGLRADRFTGGCRRLGPETGSDPCGALNDASHVSPKLGLHSKVAEWLTLRASWSEGFALANGFVKYAIGGQPLDENVFRQTEIGLHLTAAESLEFDVAAYRLRSTGEVRTVSPGVYENFGATVREGIEASARWKPSELFQLSAAYGLAESEVEENGDTRLLGLSVPGVPDKTANIEATFSPIANWSFNAAWSYVGEYEVDALNTVQAASYGLLDLGLAYTRNGDRSYRVYARVDNVTGHEYATSVSLIGGQQLFAPGSPRAVRAGIQFNF
jgi:iron complex outermembrane recepter protein